MCNTSQQYFQFPREICRETRHEYGRCESLMDMEILKDSLIYPPGQPANETSVATIISFTFSSIGIGLSATAFFLLILTAIRFREWRTNYKNQLLIQFMLARILYTIVRYICDVSNVFRLHNTETVIFIDVFGMIYTEVALISWMFVFSKQMYEDIVKVFGVTDLNIIKTSFYTWFIPGVASILLYLAYYFQYDKKLQFHLIYSFVKWPVLTANAVLLIKVLKSVLSNNQRKGNNLRIIIVMVLLIFLFSFNLIIIDIYKIVFVVLLNNYLSFLFLIGSILPLYHCAFSILFWLFGNANTRKLWLEGNKVRPNSLDYRTSTLPRLNLNDIYQTRGPT